MDPEPPPLYFTTKKYDKTPGFTDYDVCIAATKVVQKECIKGVQRVGNLWRIYVTSIEARANLAAKGIDLQNKHVALSTVHPFSFQSTDGERPIRINLSGVKLHYKNEYIEDYIKGLGVKLVSEVMYAKIRDTDGKDTNFFNGNRYVFAEATHLRSHPLPQWILLADCITRVRHYGQQPQATVCTKCFSNNHPVWNCQKEQHCRVCKIQGHSEGTEACSYYCEDNGVKPFGGKDDVLSNFYPCKFDYNGNKYQTREQCIQHQKAMISECYDEAQAIMDTKEPGKAKQLSRCIRKSITWEAAEMDLYHDFCYAAAKQNDEYYDALIDSGEKILVEALMGQNKWGSGLHFYATTRTDRNHFPGSNFMGQIHMDVRKRLIDEQNTVSKLDDNTDMFITPKKTAKHDGDDIEALELIIDNKFDALVDVEGTDGEQKPIDDNDIDDDNDYNGMGLEEGLEEVQ